MKPTFCTNCGVDTTKYPHKNCVTPQRDEEHKGDWEKRFEANRPRTDEKLLYTQKESEYYKFGYKHMEGDTIHEVTDWGNIKSFIRTERTTLLQSKAEELLRGTEAIRWKYSNNLELDENTLIHKLESIDDVEHLIRTVLLKK